MLDLGNHQTKAIRANYDTYSREIGTHLASFDSLRKIFLEQKSENPNYQHKTGEEIGNDFYYFLEDYYFELRKQEVKAPIKYELKPHIELIELENELNSQLNEQSNELKVCATCRRKFAGIKAFHGHQRTCKPN